jgi:3-deoxy-D-manno-octulosonic-acid transferase/heptosyltransferase-1
MDFRRESSLGDGAMRRSEKIKDPKSILIIKLSAIGDVIHTLPLLEVLRENFPDARIDWVVEEASSQIIDGHQAIDHVIVSHRNSWQEQLLRGRESFAVLKEIREFLRELRSEAYDLVIDLQGLFKSAILVGLSRGKKKIGPIWGREGSRLFLTEIPFHVEADTHAVEKYLKVAEYLKCGMTSWKGDIPIREADKNTIDRVLHDNRVEEKSLVAINPMAKWTTKLWESEKFAALANRLQKELSCKVVFTGSRQDLQGLDKITQRMEEKPLNLTGETHLKELAYLYSRCQLLVTTDTGPMHLAAAMGCPVVALFGPTAPWRTGPYGPGHVVIRQEMACSPCLKKKCEHVRCMRDITVDKVFDAVKQQLNLLGLKK